MDSALTPRDIQARIRAGETVEDVALAAGVPVERVEPFAAPVLAERAHVAGLALSSPVRRRGEHASVRPLRTATTESLVARGVDPDDVAWDASLLGARRWQVTATFERGQKHHVAQFVYDLNGRFSVAGNDDARWMIGESNARSTTAPTPAPQPQPQPLAEVDDELALVRAIQDDESDDAYSEAELAEVDGVYELVESDDPEMDALYDMLASFDEDSVRIYTGLVRPDEAPPVYEEPGQLTQPEAPRGSDGLVLPEGARVESLYADDPEDASEEPSVADEAVEDTEVLDLEPEVIAEPPVAAKPKPSPAPKAQTKKKPPAKSAPASPATPDPEPGQPDQPSLVDDDEVPEPRKPARKGRRASVPSWDEIMFGAPRQPGDRR